MLLKIVCSRLLPNIKCSKWPVAAISSGAIAEKTALYDFHVKNDGKLIDFAGYLLPVQYKNLGIPGSHLHTRRFGSIFDVSHMLQTYVHGKHAIECFEKICTADLRNLPISSGTLTIFTNQEGGILDDLIVSKIAEDQLYVVSNAGMRKQDIAIMETAVKSYRAEKKDVHIEFLEPSDRSLIAVQGPRAVGCIERLLGSANILSKLYFMQTREIELAGIQNCRITRCGYTGEDGVEISVASEKSVQLVETLLSFGDGATGSLQLAGLGARDSLRLEAGLCLYGNDIDAKTTPVEAGLTWLVAKRRRADADFPGAKRINEQIAKGAEKIRIGFRYQTKGGAAARQSSQIFDTEENAETSIGFVTSGCPSPTLGYNIGMGYVTVLGGEKIKPKPGTSIRIKVRDRFYATEIVKLPFIPGKYYVIKK